MNSEYPVGSWVKLRFTNEKGIVLSSWYNEEMGCVDYYVGFTCGDPSTEPPFKPYVLRYLETSLESTLPEEQP